MIIYDPKAEIWDMTSGSRAEAGHIVYRFDPSPETPSCQYNPLSAVRLDTEYEVSDVQSIAQMIVDDGETKQLNHWQVTAISLITGAILHVLYKAKLEGAEACLYDVALLLADPNKSMKIVLREMMNTEHLGEGNGPHLAVAQEAAAMISRDVRDSSSIISTALSQLTLIP